MQLSANAVNWKMMVELQKSGRLEEVMRSEECDAVFVDDVPWPSDSCVQYSEVAAAYKAIQEYLSSDTRAAADKIMSAFFCRWDEWWIPA